jgi:predicted metalloprotease with PDZ domain
MMDFPRLPLFFQAALAFTGLLAAGSSPGTAIAQSPESPPADSAAEVDGSSAAPVPSRGIDYEVDFSDALNHYITVQMTAMPSAPETQLMMAVWTPGSYLVREYARHVDRIEARDAAGNPLDMEKISKNRWKVVTADTQAAFTVTYRVFCDELTVRTNFATRGYAVLNGAATFLTIPEQIETPHRVRLRLPDAWPRSATSLRKASEDVDHYLAEDYHELVDSPIVAGNIPVYPFQVAGIDHFLANVNDRGEWDGQRAAADLAKVVAAHHKLWGNVPYERYWFLNVVGGGGGGLEHDNSCLIMSNDYTMRDERAYRRWLGLCSHEFFHVWNVRRLRPLALVHYDYESEVYTPSLWVAEGVTTYYEDLLLVRGGLLEPDEYLDMTGRTIRSLQDSPGRLVQSLRDSSHDAWIKYYRPAANSDDTQISYYTKGAVVAMLLDTRIRAASGGQKSLDDALRLLYERHAGSVGYSSADFRQICNEVAGADLSEWFSRAVDSTAELDYQEMADWYGLQIGDVRPSNVAAREPDEEEPQPPPRWIGIGESGSPATRAGLSDSDELIAINGVRLRDDLQQRLQDFEAGDPIEVLVSRDEQIVEVLVTVGSMPRQPDWGLEIVEGASKEQRARLDAWLGVTNEKPQEPAAADSGD